MPAPNQASIPTTQAGGNALFTARPSRHQLHIGVNPKPPKPRPPLPFTVPF